MILGCMEWAGACSVGMWLDHSDWFAGGMGFVIVRCASGTLHLLMGTACVQG